MRDAGISLKNYGIRLDSGDLAYMSKKARVLLDEAGFEDAYISASSDLDEYLIESLKLQGCRISSWGVGTNLITSRDCPAFGGVYKLAAIKDEKTQTFIPKIKLSENTEKITNPGDKTIFRIYDKTPVSYTQLDVYKRQQSESNPHTPWSVLCSAHSSASPQAPRSGSHTAP